MNKHFMTIGFLAAAIGLSSCNNQTANNNESAQMENEKVDTVNGEWIELFDGKSLAGWHGYNKTEEVSNWIIEDGALVCLGASKWDTGGDIVTDQELENFELVWDWKLEPGSNSGVMYHVVEDAKYKGPYETGPEYQMID